MKIDPHGPNPQQSISKSDESLAIRGKGNQNQSSESLAAKASHSTNVESLKLRELVNELKTNTGIREDLVNQIQKRVQSGEYLTPQAAGKTAEGILGLDPAE